MLNTHTHIYNIKLISLFVLLINFTIPLSFAQIKESKESEVVSESDEYEEQAEKELSEVGKKANAIDDFRERKMKDINDLYQNQAFSVVFDTERVKEQLDMLSTQYNEVQRQYAEVSSRKTKIDGKYSDILNTIKTIMKDIADTKKQVEDRLMKIKDFSVKLKKLQDQLDEMKESIDETKDNLSSYTNLLYKINNDYYSDNKNVDDLKLFVKSENIAETLSTEEVIHSLTFKLDELLDVVNKKRMKFAQHSQILNDMKSQYSLEVKEYKIEVESMQQQKKYVIELFQFFKDDKIELDTKYEQLTSNKVNLQDQIKKLLTEKKERLEQTEITGGVNIRPLLQSKERDDGDKFFTWPVLGVKRISSYFDDKDYQKEFGVLHKGIDIPRPQGSEIYSPANGIVYKVVNQDGPGLNRMIMFHKYGYVTVYIHMNKIFVQPGDYVSRGQLIGLIGGKPGTRGAGLLTTGPHLHFEIIKNGEYIDPLTIMDLSGVVSKNGLKNDYHLKYLKDRYSKPIDLTKISYMKGNTLNERRQNFLNIFASSSFSQLSLWEDAAREYNIDVDMGICIGFSETGLGKHYARNSLYNVGNVGNNDRGDRRGFDSPLAGAKAIYATLNNKYLNKYWSIDQLSRYGNASDAIYASSPINWQSNMVKCLSVIKGYRVAEEHPFRVYSLDWEQNLLNKNKSESNVHLSAGDEPIETQPAIKIEAGVAMQNQPQLPTLQSSTDHGMIKN
ncbi:MAG: peptidoglycan DD-metalloendopeptidase family protein [Candidatus Absconditabacteria bacterium]